MSGGARLAPRHLRFAQALAFVSGLGACGPGTNGPTVRALPREAARPVSAGPAAACPCSCAAGATNPPHCSAIGRDRCCPTIEVGIVEGPLPPPDLPG